MGHGSASSPLKGPQETGDLIEIFADGACSGNPGPGGYGAILRYRDREKEISGCETETTNNRMELRAVIEALRLIRRPSRIRVITDSNYVVKGMSEWLPRWIRRNWISAGKKPVLNRGLWEDLIAASRPHRVEWVWIRGHAGHADNERCDRLARAAIRRCWTAGGEDSVL
ncbi:MAG: ribonuclease HI [Thermodesulfobacteriota bacterium]